MRGSHVIRISVILTRKIGTEATEIVFKMSDLSPIFDESINIPLCAKSHDYVKSHTSGLRKTIVFHFRQLLSIKYGNGYQHVRDKINFFSYADGDPVGCMRFLKYQRKEISAQCDTFSGNFPENFLEKLVPPALLVIGNMILYGSSVPEN